MKLDKNSARSPIILLFVFSLLSGLRIDHAMASNDTQNLKLDVADNELQMRQNRWANEQIPGMTSNKDSDTESTSSKNDEIKKTIKELRTWLETKQKEAKKKNEVKSTPPKIAILRSFKKGKKNANPLTKALEALSEHTEQKKGEIVPIYGGDGKSSHESDFLVGLRRKGESLSLVKIYRHGIVSKFPSMPRRQAPLLQHTFKNRSTISIFPLDVNESDNLNLKLLVNHINFKLNEILAIKDEAKKTKSFAIHDKRLLKLLKSPSWHTIKTATKGIRNAIWRFGRQTSALRTMRLRRK